MKIDLDGTFAVVATPDESFAFITDPDRFAPLLPYFQELRKGEDGRFTVVLEVGVPQIRGRAEVDTTLVEAVAPSRVLYRTTGRHALGMMDSTLSFALSPAAAGGTEVAWTAAGAVSGTLASLAQGLLVPLAKRQIKALVVSVQGALGAPAAEEAPAKAVPGRIASLKGLFSRKEGAA